MIKTLQCIEIEALQADRHRADRIYTQRLKSIQKACAHADIAEDDEQPPWRICLFCGVTEVGWGPGYTVLKGRNPRKIDAADLLFLSCGLRIYADKKGPIIRHEKTVGQLIDED